MRTPAALLALLLLVACGEDSGGEAPPARGPVGTWALDVEALKASFSRMIEGEVSGMVKRGELPSDQAGAARARMLSEVEGLLASKRAFFTLGADGTFIGEGSDGTMAGRWTVEGSRIAMTIDQEGGRFVPKPDVWRGTWSAKAIVLRPEPDKDYEMTLIREATR